MSWPNPHGIDISFGDNFALMDFVDSAPLEFHGSHFAQGRDPVSVHFRYRTGWRFRVYEPTSASTPLKPVAIQYEERGTPDHDLTLQECVDLMRACLARWEAEEKRRLTG
jgi:hypothetical protein